MIRSSCSAGSPRYEWSCLDGESSLPPSTMEWLCTGGRDCCCRLFAVTLLGACEGGGAAALLWCSASRKRTTMASRPRSMARDSGVQRFSTHSPCHVSGSAFSSTGITSTAMLSTLSGNTCSRASITSTT